MEVKQASPAYRVGIYYLTQNRGGRWCRTWYDEPSQQRKLVSLRTEDFEQGKLKLDAWFIENNKPVLADDLELSVAVVEYYTQHANHLARSDAENRNLMQWLDYFKTARIREIRPTQQRAFIHSLVDRGYAKSTVEAIFKTGVSAITFAFKNEMLAQMPPIVSTQKELSKFNFTKKPRWRAMEISEIARLIENSNTDRLARFIMILLGTGCRPGAALELTGKQFDLKSGTVDLLKPDSDQNNKYRPTVRLPTFLRAIYHKDNICSHRALAISSTKPLDSIRSSWNTARRNSGLDQQVTPYSIRHSVAKWLRTCGVEAWHTSNQLGHKKRGNEITEIYASSDPKYLSEAVEAIEAYFAIIYSECPKLMGKKWLENYHPRCDLVAKYKKFI